MRMFRHFLFAALLVSMCPSGFSQVILNTRQWTNQSGQKMSAEMLAFGSEWDRGLVKLRRKGGQVFQVDLTTLSETDQAVILKQKVSRGFRTRSSDEAEFFYSKRVDGRKGKPITESYIGSDPESSWVRIKNRIPVSAGSNGKALIYTGAGDPVRIPYEFEDVEMSGGCVTVDLSLTKHTADLANLLQQPNRLRILIEKTDGSYGNHQLSANEIAAITDVVSAFRVMRRVSPDFVWWSVYKDLSDEQIAELRKPDVPEEVEMPQPVVTQGPEAIYPMNQWTEHQTQTAFFAEVMGFDGHRVKFRMDLGGERAMPITDLVTKNKQT
ncbi:MAG: hypothetical protein AAF226_16580, partial [Verrucomicrobiota bacterium]